MKIRNYYISEYEPKFKEIHEQKSVGARDRILWSTKSVLEDNPNIILDVGCGDGKISKNFKKNNNIVIGLEINRRLASEAKNYIQVILCDAEDSWPLQDESVDTIYMGAFLEHIFDYDHIFSESRRVLKKNGKLIILIPNGVSLKDRLIMLRGQQPEWYRLKGHIRFWTLHWLRKITKQHGFEELYVVGFPFPLKESLHKFKVFNPIFAFLEYKLCGLCKLLLWKGRKL